ncbi:MAG: biotin synthase BioB [Myxococcales bacterium]|nr:biotin synthase BioB [Myxococcales bacterium]
MSLPEPAALAQRILAGDDRAVDPPTLLALLSPQVDPWDLMAAADRVRRARFGNRVHLCSIVNAKEGGCPEDCGFCSQSRHFSTHVQPGRFIDPQTAVAHSARARGHQATALGLVTATRGLPEDSRGLEHVEAAIRAVREAGHTEAHASVGLLSDAALDRLVAAGLTELNHNLESGRRFFSTIVGTHTYDERIETIRRAQAKGLRTCVGGIFGMGETLDDRVELAQELRALDVDEVPLNFLVGIEGTPLAGAAPLSPREMLRIIAAYRLFLPRPNIFVAAGRTQLGQLLPLMFSAGASGMMIGDFLTTPNRGPQDDLRLLEELGLEPYGCGTTHEARPELAPAPRARLPVVA